MHRVIIVVRSLLFLVSRPLNILKVLLVAKLLLKLARPIIRMTITIALQKFISTRLFNTLEVRKFVPLRVIRSLLMQTLIVRMSPLFPLFRRWEKLVLNLASKICRSILSLKKHTRKVKLYSLKRVLFATRKATWEVSLVRTYIIILVLQVKSRKTKRWHRNTLENRRNILTIYTSKRSRRRTEKPRLIVSNTIRYRLIIRNRRLKLLW